MRDTSDRDDDHLQGIDDGCGCAEVWEALSEERRSGDGAADADADAETASETDAGEPTAAVDGRA
jgi:hypothetical protein